MVPLCVNYWKSNLCPRCEILNRKMLLLFTYTKLPMLQCSLNTVFVRHFESYRLHRMHDAQYFSQIFEYSTCGRLPSGIFTRSFVRSCLRRRKYVYFICLFHDDLHRNSRSDDASQGPTTCMWAWHVVRQPVWVTERPKQSGVSQQQLCMRGSNLQEPLNPSIS